MNELVKVEGESGQYVVTPEMLTTLPRKKFLAVNDWFEALVADNPEYAFETRRDLITGDVIIRWRRMTSV